MSSQPSSSCTCLSNRRRRPSNCFNSSSSSSSFKQNRWPELPEEAAAQVEGVGVTMISNKQSFFYDYKQKMFKLTTPYWFKLLMHSQHPKLVSIHSTFFIIMLSKAIQLLCYFRFKPFT